MRSEIKEQIEQIRCSEVPNGYIRIHGSIIPDDWGVESIGRLMTPVKKKAGEGQYQVLSITAGKGFVSQAEKFGKDISGKQYAQYTVIKNGDFSYNKGNSKTYAQGCIYLLEDWEEAAVPNVFNSFRPKSKKIIPEYYKHLFINGYLNKQLYRYINSGVRNDGLLNLYDEDFYSCLLPVPPSIEQSKIAEILTHCDKVISLKQQLIEEKKKQKKWLSEKIMWDLDSHYPMRTIKSIATYVDYRGKTPPKSESGVFLVTAKNIRDGYIDYESSKEYIASSIYEKVMKRGKPKIGDVVITTEAPCGKVAQIDNENIALAQRVILYRTKCGTNNDYLACYLRSAKFQQQLKILSTGLTAQGIKGVTLHNMKIPIPPESKQKRIADILAAADREIDLLEREFCQWQNKKKSLMQLLLTGIVRVKN